MLVATLWEFHEFIHDIYFPLYPYQLGIADTMHDYLIALAGAMVFCLVSKNLKFNNNYSIMTCEVFFYLDLSITKTANEAAYHLLSAII